MTDLALRQSEVTRRYQAYLDVHSMTFDEMREHDAREFPGGPGCGYILWIGARWREWLTSKKYQYDQILSLDDHSEFDTWLAERNAVRRASQKDGVMDGLLAFSEKP